jgi:hypothetical protein
MHPSFIIVIFLLYVLKQNYGAVRFAVSLKLERKYLGKFAFTRIFSQVWWEKL